MWRHTDHRCPAWQPLRAPLTHRASACFLSTQTALLGGRMGGPAGRGAAAARLSAAMNGSTRNASGGWTGMGTRPRGCGALSAPSGSAPSRPASAAAYSARSAAASRRATPAPSPSAAGLMHSAAPPARGGAYSKFETQLH
jgi:hypothetical protein